MVDSAGAGSIDGIVSFYYENSTGLVYVPAPVDDYLSIYNVSTKTSIVALGSVTNAVLKKDPEAMTRLHLSIFKLTPEPGMKLQ